MPYIEADSLKPPGLLCLVEVSPIYVWRGGFSYQRVIIDSPVTEIIFPPSGGCHRKSESVTTKDFHGSELRRLANVCPSQRR